MCSTSRSKLASVSDDVSVPVHRPKWQLASIAERDDGSTLALDRVSGHPAGLPQDRWPSCGVCNTPLGFVGQWSHDATRMDLGKQGRVLYAFLCLNPRTSQLCGLGPAPGQGPTEAVVVVDAVDADRATVTIPPGATTPAPPAPALVATGWDADVERCAPEALEPLLYGFNEAVHEWPGGQGPIAAARGSKCGGLPQWLQDPFFQSRGNPRRHRCVAQWDSYDRTHSTDSSDSSDKRVMGSLGSGMLYLLRDTEAAEPAFSLYFIRR